MYIISDLLVFILENNESIFGKTFIFSCKKLKSRLGIKEKFIYKKKKKEKRDQRESWVMPFFPFAY